MDSVLSTRGQQALSSRNGEHRELWLWTPHAGCLCRCWPPAGAVPTGEQRCLSATLWPPYQMTCRAGKLKTQTFKKPILKQPRWLLETSLKRGGDTSIHIWFCDLRLHLPHHTVSWASKGVTTVRKPGKCRGFSSCPSASPAPDASSHCPAVGFSPHSPASLLSAAD